MVGVWLLLFGHQIGADGARIPCEPCAKFILYPPYFRHSRIGFHIANEVFAPCQENAASRPALSTNKSGNKSGNDFTTESTQSTKTLAKKGIVLCDLCG
jgi:hypothetical protein